VQGGEVGVIQNEKEKVMEKSRYSSSDAKSYQPSVDGRYERLLQIEGYIRAVSDRHGFRDEDNIAEEIAHLHDHKGTLCVIWKSEPTDYFKDVVEVAWAECGHEEHVDHILASEDRRCESPWCNGEVTQYVPTIQ
jgi:hypothetical protein